MVRLDGIVRVAKRGEIAAGETECRNVDGVAPAREARQQAMVEFVQHGWCGVIDKANEEICPGAQRLSADPSFEGDLDTMDLRGFRESVENDGLFVL